MSTVGSCEGVEFQTDIMLPRPQAKESTATERRGSSVGYQRMQAKMIGHDVLHLPMWITWANIEWYWDDFTVWGGNFPAGNANDSYWYVLFNTNGYGYYTPPRYEHYHYVHWYSNGFPQSSAPDVEIWAQPTAKAYPWGSKGCSYWFSPGSGWGSYPDLHWVQLCAYY